MILIKFPHWKTARLPGNSVCILGSSVVYGSASGENAVGEYLSARLGFDLTKEAVSGTTLVDIGEKSYISRLKNRIDPNTDFDLFIWSAFHK